MEVPWSVDRHNSTKTSTAFLLRRMLVRCQNVYNIPASPLPPYSASRPRPAQSLVSSLHVMVSLLPLDIQYLAIGVWRGSAIYQRMVLVLTPVTPHMCNTTPTGPAWHQLTELCLATFSNLTSQLNVPTVTAVPGAGAGFAIQWFYSFMLKSRRKWLDSGKGIFYWENAN